MRMSRISWLAVPILNALFQIFMKRGSETLDGVSGSFAWLMSMLLSPWIILALLVEIVCFFIWMKVLSELEISKAFPLSGVSYVLIVGAGWFAFGEPVAWLQMIGGGLILSGVWLIATANPAKNRHEAKPQITIGVSDQ
jgi:cyclopropane-fatty-acyl-phospholipid synthase